MCTACTARQPLCSSPPARQQQPHVPPRPTLQGGKGQADCLLALGTLYAVLLDVVKVMAPFTPFLTESMYQNLRRCLPPGAVPESVHFCDIPPVVEVRLCSWWMPPAAGGIARGLSLQTGI
jgi:hypothetical protein